MSMTLSCDELSPVFPSDSYWEKPRVCRTKQVDIQQKLISIIIFLLLVLSEFQLLKLHRSLSNFTPLLNLAVTSFNLEAPCFTNQISSLQVSRDLSQKWISFQGKFMESDHWSLSVFLPLETKFICCVRMGSLRMEMHAHASGALQ